MNALICQQAMSKCMLLIATSPVEHKDIVARYFSLARAAVFKTCGDDAAWDHVLAAHNNALYMFREKFGEFRHTNRIEYKSRHIGRSVYLVTKNNSIIGLVHEDNIHPNPHLDVQR